MSKDKLFKYKVSPDSVDCCTIGSTLGESLQKIKINPAHTNFRIIADLHDEGPWCAEKILTIRITEFDNMKGE